MLECTSEKKINYDDNTWSVFDHNIIDMFAVKMQENGGFNLLSFNKIGGKRACAALPSQKARI
jgi:hypothetical protein